MSRQINALIAIDELSVSSRSTPDEWVEHWDKAARRPIMSDGHNIDSTWTASALVPPSSKR